MIPALVHYLIRYINNIPQKDSVIKYISIHLDTFVETTLKIVIQRHSLIFIHTSLDYKIKCMEMLFYCYSRTF